ncbi:MAG: hypothetical protein ACKV0T_20605 [Planctomycetales bacterium]
MACALPISGTVAVGLIYLAIGLLNLNEGHDSDQQFPPPAEVFASKEVAPRIGRFPAIGQRLLLQDPQNLAKSHVTSTRDFEMSVRW